MSVYAKEFAQRIANSRVEIINDCGHVPQVERLEIVKPMVGELFHVLILKFGSTNGTFVRKRRNAGPRASGGWKPVFGKDHSLAIC